MTPKLIYIEWADAVGKQHYSPPDALPAAVILRGYTTLVEEGDDHIVVAHFMASDGGFMDTVAIPRRSIARLDVIDAISPADAHEELGHGY